MRVQVIRRSPGHDPVLVDPAADLVISVPPADDNALDRFGQVYTVSYTDEDSADLAVVECLERIKRAWEESHDDAQESSLGHSAAALWFFYWVSPDMVKMPELVRRNRSQDLRDAATDYVESGFGESRGPSLALKAA